MIGQPHDFSRNWSYTALSRAREPVELYLIDEPGLAEQERDEIAPGRRHARPDDPLERMHRRLRKRDDEDLALEPLDRAEPQTQQRAQDGVHAAVGFVSPARTRLYELELQLQDIHEQRRALPIQEAEGIERITKTMAGIEIEAEHDPRARSWSERRDRKLRQRDRENSLQWLRDQQTTLLATAPEPRAVLDRAKQLSDQQTTIGEQSRRCRTQAITEELASHPPWLEQTLGPEPPDHAFNQERWRRTAAKSPATASTTTSPTPKQRSARTQTFRVKAGPELLSANGERRPIPHSLWPRRSSGHATARYLSLKTSPVA